MHNSDTFRIDRSFDNENVEALIIIDTRDIKVDLIYINYKRYVFLLYYFLVLLLQYMYFSNRCLCEKIQRRVFLRISKQIK